MQAMLAGRDAGALVSGEVDRGPEGLLGGGGIRGIAFQQDFAAEAMDKGEVATIVALTGEVQRIIDVLRTVSAAIVSVSSCASNA